MAKYLTCESRDTIKSFGLFLFAKIEIEYTTQSEIRNTNFKNYSSWFTFSTQRRIWSFHVAVLKRTATVMKCTNNYDARAQALFFSLNFSFSDIAVPTVVGTPQSNTLLYYMR